MHELKAKSKNIQFSSILRGFLSQTDRKFFLCLTQEKFLRSMVA